jgi:DNA-binding response OmpR family regulator
MNILIIEDEETLARSIGAYLSDEHYICSFVTSFKEAMDKVAMHEYDCILLDLMLPGGDGMRILEELKQLHKQDGVIIISAKDSLEDKIKGLQLGADDYLIKPFHLSELAARIYSVIRRKQSGSTNIIELNELKINLQAQTVHINDHPAIFTRKEFNLLLYFISNKNKVISKSALAEHLSGEMATMMDSYDFVYVHIKNLKKKLQEAGCDNYLKTLYGSGYKWEV